jgi:hypothetical protein
VCQLLANGTSGADVANQILKNSDLASKQAAFFVVDSVQTYCPQFQGQLR